MKIKMMFGIGIFIFLALAVVVYSAPSLSETPTLDSELSKNYSRFSVEINPDGVETHDPNKNMERIFIMIKELRQENNLMKQSLCKLGETIWC